MQGKIKKRAELYGVAAVLLALVLGSIFYGIGFIPQIQLSQRARRLDAHKRNNNKLASPFF